MKRELNFEGRVNILYLVATPIGNLEDMSPRALKVLNEVEYVAAEDTRTSGLLLSHFGISKPLISCHEHNEEEASKKITDLLFSGHSIAYMSDAGYPGISDPGERLVKAALDLNIKVSVISGPSALLNALVASGLKSDHFYFHGFLESRDAARESELQELVSRPETLIFYEAPHRIEKTLKSMFEVFGDRRACIGRELTKIHEEYIRGNLGELAQIDPATLRGEMVIVVEGSNTEITPVVSDEQIVKFVTSLTDVGISTKDAIRQASLVLKVNKNYIYKLYHTN